MYAYVCDRKGEMEKAVERGKEKSNQRKKGKVGREKERE